MGTNTLTTRTDGETIPASDHNEILQALREDLVPRNNSNAPEDIIGSLGTSALRWLRAYINELRLGDAANNLVISEAATGEIHILRDIDKEKIIITNGNIDFYVNNVLKGRFNSNGLSGVYLEDFSTPREKLEQGMWQESPLLSGGRGDVAGPIATPFTVSGFVIGQRYSVRQNGGTAIVSGGGGFSSWGIRDADDLGFAPYSVTDYLPNAIYSPEITFTFIATKTSYTFNPEAQRSSISNVKLLFREV